jgi:gamma-glutamyltranspeptidase/glutathione hydrolase
LAREGFAVSPVIAAGWARNLDGFRAGSARIEAAEHAFAVYAPGGRAPAAGEAFANPDLAATYALIAGEGAPAFTRGAFSADLERFARAHGRAHRAADLAGLEAEWVKPIAAPYRGHMLWQIPPATQGLTTLQMARMVERFPVAGLSEADRLHLFIEAKKLAFADRARFLADPARVSVPVAALLADDYIAARARRIDMGRALPEDVSPGDPEGEQGDTTYLAVADAQGLMVSLIQSNYRGMGSGVVVPRSDRSAGATWGFMLQNRGAQFALDPAHANAIAPGKRPFHTIIPGMVTRGGGPFLAFGVMGGTMQPQGQVQVLSNILDLGMNLQAAGDAPRVRHLGSPDPGDGQETPPGVAIEPGFAPATRVELAGRGHRLLDTPQAMGGYQAVMWDEARRCWWGATEKRNDGVALGV